MTEQNIINIMNINNVENYWINEVDEMEQSEKDAFKYCIDNGLFTIFNNQYIFTLKGRRFYNTKK